MSHPVLRIVAVRGAQASLLALLVHWLFRWPLTGPHALGLIFTPLLILYFVFTFVAPWTWGLPITTFLPGRERQVALTFDDGPSPETTPVVLDVLQKHGARATFFVLGEAVERHADLLERILAEGHTLGIHAYRHHSLVLAPWPELFTQIERTSATIRRACPEAPAPVWFRPPYGFKTAAMPFLARHAGCRMAAWSVDSRDYNTRRAADIARAVLAQVRPGAIVLLHDGPTNTATADALPLILDGLAARGCRGVSLGPP